VRQARSRRIPRDAVSSGVHGNLGTPWNEGGGIPAPCDQATAGGAAGLRRLPRDRIIIFPCDSTLSPLHPRAKHENLLKRRLLRSKWHRGTSNPRLSRRCRSLRQRLRVRPGMVSRRIWKERHHGRPWKENRNTVPGFRPIYVLPVNTRPQNAKSRSKRPHSGYLTASCFLLGSSASVLSYLQLT